MIRNTLLRVAGCAGAWLLLAAAGPPPSRLDACLKTAVSTMEMVDCQNAEMARLDALLNAAYAKAMANLPADQQAKLRTAERNWIVFRQSDCEVFYGETTGTIAHIQGGECMIDRTRKRIEDLRKIDAG